MKAPDDHLVKKKKNREKMKTIAYQDARYRMAPGNVIAFSGKGYISAVIKIVTACPVTHVGIIMHANIPVAGQLVNQIIESTSLGDGFAGVQINRMSIHMQKYDGRIWWLPLSDEARSKLDQKVFFDFLLQQEGKQYDTPQAIGSALDFLPDNREDLDKLFCSELNAAALEKAGVLKDINASKQTPADIIRLNIYDDVYQLKGDFKEITA